MSAIAAIHIAKNELGLDDDTYRSFLHMVVGKTSTKDMSPAEHGRVLDAMVARGAGQKKQPLAGPYGAKLQALWISGWNLGLVRNQNDQALLEFVRGQTGIDHTRFLRDAKDARKAVEALKKWLERSGVDWAFSADPKDCVIQAQVDRLGGDRVVTLPTVIAWKSGQSDNKAKLALMKRLGSRIRAQADGAAKTQRDNDR